MSPNLRGALLMMASMAAFTLNDACIKATDNALPLFQLLTLRGIVTTLLIYLLARRLGALRFNLSHRDWMLVASLAVLAFFGIGSIGTDWQPLDMCLSLLVAGASFFILGGYLFSVMVMRVGDISFIAPFRYTGLLWALALGWLVFGDWPSDLTMLGAIIVVSTGVFTLYRERNVKATSSDRR
ncbi:hypothetical protein [Sedimentitalea sp.]|uniref:hypothetical protein n=1 Tax=Sedimentitalea sp. TaxID=2048915 RepID=UPI003299D8EA